MGAGRDEKAAEGIWVLPPRDFGLHGIVLALGAQRRLGAVPQHDGQQAVAALPVGRLHVWKRKVQDPASAKEMSQRPSPSAHGPSRERVGLQITPGTSSPPCATNECDH